jgi:hypothetical protein
MIGAKAGQWRAYGVVRDKDGKPRIDDPNNIPDEMWKMLTPEEQKEIKNGKTK